MDQYAAVFGRLHPLLLHLPIGLVAGIVALEAVELWRGERGKSAAPAALLWLNAAVALLAAFTGLKLSQEDGYGGWTLTIHLWLGLAVAAAAIAAAVARSIVSANARPVALHAYRASLVLVLGLIIFAGHFGATMTHGEDFVLGPLRSTGQPEAEAFETVDFGAYGASSEQGFAVVRPIFAETCLSCHSGSRAKGGLVLDSFEALMRGSEIGPVITADDPKASELLRRIELPAEDPDHMPPAGKRQLSAEQIAMIRAWIVGEKTEGKAQLAGTDAAHPGATHAAADPAAIGALRATLAYASPIAADSNLLWIDVSFAQPPLDEEKMIELLRPLAANIAQLSLSRCVITDQFASFAKDMPNLRRLDLHGTAASDATIAVLAEHPGISELALTKTAVTDASVAKLLAMPELARVYLWGSKLTPAGIERLRTQRPELVADAGEFAEAEELLAEADPKFVDAGPKPDAAGAPAAASLTPINTICPVSDRPVDARYLVVHQGRVIGFCCTECPKQFWADPSKFVGKLK